MKAQQKPVFLVKKFYSILQASVAVETVSFFVTLSDSVIAGNMIGNETLVAVGLLSPLFTIETFIMSRINGGTFLYYNRYVGKYDKKKADEVIAQGLFLTVLAGILSFLGMMAAKNAYIGMFSQPEKVVQYAKEYYNLFAVYLAVSPLGCLLDNLLVADGGAHLSAAANITEIITNIVLSLLFVRFFGIRGIALATLCGKGLFYLIIAKWNYVRLKSVFRVFRLNLEKCRKILLNGTVKASRSIFAALMEVVLMLYAASRFEHDTIILLSIAIKVLRMSDIIVGLSMASQPLIGTLSGEKNYWGIRCLMKEVLKIIAGTGAIMSILTILFAPFFVRAFGLNDRLLLESGTVMMRYLSLSFVFQAPILLFYVYDFVMQKNGLTLMIVVLKEFLLPVTLSLLAVQITQTQTGLWMGLALAPAAALLLSMLGTYILYGKDRFPWLVPKDNRVRCYDFEINDKNAVNLSETLISLLADQGYPPSTGIQASLISEEVLLLIKEKNPPGRKKLYAECTVILEESGIRLIFRDSGRILDVMGSDGTGSLREYAVSRLVLLPEYNMYLTTVGYNRNELWLNGTAE